MDHQDGDGIWLEVSHVMRLSSGLTMIDTPGCFKADSI
jgi:hypothetical protein